MMVDFAIHNIGSLIITAGDHTSATDVEGVQIVITTVGILNTNNPGCTLCISGSGSADIAAHTDQKIIRCRRHYPLQ